MYYSLYNIYSICMEIYMVSISRGPAWAWFIYEYIVVLMANSHTQHLNAAHIVQLKVQWLRGNVWLTLRACVLAVCTFHFRSNEQHTTHMMRISLCAPAAKQSLRLSAGSILARGMMCGYNTRNCWLLGVLFRYERLKCTFFFFFGYLTSIGCVRYSVNKFGAKLCLIFEKYVIITYPMEQVFLSNKGP